MKKYDSYKDSGVKWLGEIPEHWKIRKLKWIFTEKKKVTNPSLNCGSISFGKVVYKDDEKIPEATKKSYQVVNKGEFLLNPLNLNYDLKSLRIALSEIDVVVSSGYIVLQNQIQIHKDYYKWLLHIYDILYMKTLGAGVRQTINFYDISESLLCLPRDEEQKAIAEFLDDKTSKIDQAISIKEKEIVLLKERRQILIQKAVTRGLDPNVKMKDSGVDWIGEIPEHWEVRRIKSLTRVKRGASPRPIDNQIYFDNDGDYSWVRIADVTKSEKYLIKTEQKLSKLGSSLSVKLEPGELFLSIAGSVGKPIINKIKSCIHDGFVYFPDLKLSKEWLYIIFTLDSPFHNLGKIGTQLNLNTDTVGMIKCPIPSEQEIMKILLFINNIEEKISKAISLKQQEIEKLKEYKTILIDNAVMGKMKVC